MNRIEEALIQRFEDHRIIFWYDEKEELIDQFNEIDISKVEKIHVQGNEFEVKYLINKVNPESKFLLYFTGAKPTNEENWLLDMELAHHVFHTDQEAMFLQEIGLDYHFKELVSEHIEFFKNGKRRLKLKESLGEGDEHQELRYKMLAVLFGTDYVNLVTFIHAHGTAYVDGNEKYDKYLIKFNLKEFYWKEIGRKYNYQNEEPSIYDFLMEAFNNNFALGKRTGLSKETKLLLSLWQDTITYRDSFRTISSTIAEDIGVEGMMMNSSIEEVVQDNLFELTDKKVIHDLIQLIAVESISKEAVGKIIKQRENKFWYSTYQGFYSCIRYASELILLVKKHQDIKFESFGEGVSNYAKELYQIDLLYRKFIRNYRATNQNSILNALAEKVEKIYSNDWLLTFNNNWQTIIDSLDTWSEISTRNQRSFFRNQVTPFISKGQRLFVIISDAFRYECGAEFHKLLQKENRYESHLDYLITGLPSYTQLGMTSLLPNKKLTIKENSDTVIADDIPSMGIQGRTKILEKNSGVRATAINAEEFMKMKTTTEGREFVKNHDLIYIFHNRIDKLGDDKTTEEKVFDAVEEELEFLMDMLKKIANMNGTNMMVTSDHGFIYQNQQLDESDFSKVDIKGDIWKENRRFIIGKNLSTDASVKHFKGSQLNLNEDIDVLIPKSINRLRIKGAGSRFIHGGSTLQEVIVPLIKITKKRQDTTNLVDIDIIQSTNKITTNIQAVSFIQSESITDKLLPRTIRAGIYSEDDELLSDQFKYKFDIEADMERQREVKHRFQLSSKASGKYKNQQVKLVLEEPVEGTTKWKHYKDYYYTLNISFTSDFDDF